MPPGISMLDTSSKRKMRHIQSNWSLPVTVPMIFFMLTLVGGVDCSVRFSRTPARVAIIKSGERMPMASAIRLYPVVALPPQAFLPVVRSGIRTEANTLPIPAKSVALAVMVLRSSASEDKAGTMPQ